MTPSSTKMMRVTVCCAIALFLAGASLAWTQDQQDVPAQSQVSPGWRQFKGGSPSGAVGSANQSGTTNPWQPYGATNTQQATASASPTASPLENTAKPDPSKGHGPTIPPRLTVQSGSYLTVRTNQILSSKQNQPGDQFTATLEEPVVVDGFVVAQRGETVVGRVVAVKKAGRIRGVSQLAVKLTRLTLVDGRQVGVQTQMIGEKGPTSRGRDAAGVVTTTGLGAAIGAAANGGVGAAVGAGAGAIAGTIGVLVTRGRPTIIYPETKLTFSINAPVVISTTQAPQAFHYVTLDAYANAPAARRAPPPSLCNQPGCASPPPYAYYGPPSYPPFAPLWGPRVFLP
jgi:hypothetical protein